MLSGNPVVIYRDDYDIILIASIFIYSILFIYRKGITIIDIRVSTIILGFLIIHGFQTLINQDNQIYTVTGHIIKIFTAYLTVKITKNFIHKYINILTLLTISSLFFYIPSLFIDIKHYFHFLMPMPDRIEHIYIYNFMIVYLEWVTLDDSYRNASLFWEPAAFGGYLAIGILFLGLLHNRLPRKEIIFKYLILFIGLISTISTTSYIIMTLLILINFRHEVFLKKNKFSIFILMLPILLIILQQAYINIPILKDKISIEIDRTLSNDDNFQSTRLGGLLFDWEEIKEKPIFGWGPDPHSRKINFDEIKQQGNGLTGYVIKFGILGLFLYTYFLYKSTLKISGKSVFFGISAVSLTLLLLNTEYYLNFPFFYTLLFFSKNSIQPIKLK